MHKNYYFSLNFVNFDVIRSTNLGRNFMLIPDWTNPQSKNFKDQKKKGFIGLYIPIISTDKMVNCWWAEI